MSIFDSLLKGAKKQIVGVSLTPGIGLEAVVLDKDNKQVQNYARRDVLYNFSTREIQNMSQFKTQFNDLMSELQVPQKSLVHIVLPNVLFDFMEAPPELMGEDLKTMILSKAEEFYLFKRDEPVSGWCEVVNPESGTQKKYAYTSFQKSTVDQIRDMVGELDFTLVGIESNFSATLRGLYLTGMLDDVVIEEAYWTMMLINTNSYTLFHMNGKNLISYNEVPLAIKSFSMEEAYQAIVQSSSQLLSNYSSSKLYIASQTDDISANVLKLQMQFDKEIIAIDSNKYAKKAPMEVVGATDFRKANSMTLSVIGAAGDTGDFSFSLNVLQDDPNIKPNVYKININGKDQEISGTQIDIISIITIIVLAVIGVAVLGSVAVYNSITDQKLSEISGEIGNLDAQIAELSKTEEKKEEIDINQIIDEVAEMNVSAINFYDSIATDIPKNVWLTKYYNKEGTRIAVRGIAESIIDIYEYYKNLRIVSPQSDIKLTELRVITSDNQSEDESKFISSLALTQDKDRLYSFEIANTEIGYQTEEELKAKQEAKEKAKDEYDEYNLLRKPLAKKVEETSQQMTIAK